MSPAAMACGGRSIARAMQYKRISASVRFIMPAVITARVALPCASASDCGGLAKSKPALTVFPSVKKRPSGGTLPHGFVRESA